MSEATGLDRRQQRRRKREAWRNWQEVTRMRESIQRAAECGGRDPARPGACSMTKGHPGGCFNDPDVDG